MTAAAQSSAAQLEEQLEQYLELRQHWFHDPELYARQRLGLRPTWQQQKILRAIAPDGAKVTVRSGHGIGKTGAEAAAILWFLETRERSRVPCTASTGAQLRDVLWAELAKWMRHSDELSARLGLVPRLHLGNLFRVTNERLFDPSAPREWYAVARTSGRDNPDALQGFHATDVQISEDGRGLVSKTTGGHIMFVIEEASGVFEKVYEVAEGALSSEGARLLMCGNPTKNTGYFARSHKQDRAEFTALHFRTSDSPLADPDYRPRLVRKFGEGSNVVRVRADGEFPKQEDDVLIALEVAEAAIDRDPQPLEPHMVRRMGIDVARFGDDRTCFCFRIGWNVYALRVEAKLRTTEVVGIALQLGRELRVQEFCVDTGGVGGGVADQLREKGQRVVEVEFGAAAPARAEGDDAPQGRVMRDYLFLEARKWLETGRPSFQHCERDHAEELAGELCSIKYTMDSDGRVIVESKDAMKRRGLRSPDLADALVCTFAPHSAMTARVASAGRRAFGGGTR